MAPGFSVLQLLTLGLALLARVAVARQCIKTCIMPKNTTVPGGDDSPGILAAIAACGPHSRLVFQKGVTYNIYTPWKFTNLTNVELVFEGNLTLSDNVTDVQSVVRNSKIYPGQWIQIRGENVSLTGSTSPDGGWFIGKITLLAIAVVFLLEGLPGHFWMSRTRRAVVGNRELGESAEILRFIREV